MSKESRQDSEPIKKAPEGALITTTRSRSRALIRGEGEPRESPSAVEAGVEPDELLGPREVNAPNRIGASPECTTHQQTGCDVAIHSEESRDEFDVLQSCNRREAKSSIHRRRGESVNRKKLQNEKAKVRATSVLFMLPPRKRPQRSQGTAR